MCTVVKSKVEISQNFVAFSEYMNFILPWDYTKNWVFTINWEIYNFVNFPYLNTQAHKTADFNQSVCFIVQNVK